MWQTNFRVLMVGVATLGFYTLIAQIIPQIESGVPETLDLSGDLSPDRLVDAGEGLYNGAGGCTACHGLGSRAPSLLTDHGGQGAIGQRCGDRQSGVACKTYLYESMVAPSAFIVDDFPPIMPDASRQLSPDQIWAIVAFLENQGGTVTVTADDVRGGAGTGAPAATAPAPAAAPGGFSDATDPMQILTVNACIGCHAINGVGPPIGPSFDGMGARLSADEIRRGILDPAAEIAEGFEQFAGMMPPTFGSTLSAQQLEAIVQFLAGRR